MKIRVQNAAGALLVGLLGCAQSEQKLDEPIPSPMAGIGEESAPASNTPTPPQAPAPTPAAEALPDAAMPDDAPPDMPRDRFEPYAGWTDDKFCYPTYSFFEDASDVPGPTEAFAAAAHEGIAYVKRVVDACPPWVVADTDYRLVVDPSDLSVRLDIDEDTTIAAFWNGSEGDRMCTRDGGTLIAVTVEEPDGTAFGLGFLSYRRGTLLTSGVSVGRNGIRVGPPREGEEGEPCFLRPRELQ